MATDKRALPDLQASTPSAPLSLTKAGVTRSAKAIRIHHNGREQLFQAEVACFADLATTQKGVHMSRFEESINEAIDDVVIGEALHIEVLAERIAERVAVQQRALRSEVTIRASYPIERRTPVTEIPTQETYGLIGIAAVSPAGPRRIVGVSAQGMNACPCAQELIRAQASAALEGGGYGEDQIEEILRLVPVATHNQRARGTLLVGDPGGSDVPAELLLRIVEESMSSEIYELMKRPDEQYVVDRAHRRPRFVEDSVREMVKGVVEQLPGLSDATFLRAHQANFETIHTHDVEAERSGLLGEIRSELRGEAPVGRHVTLAEWLGAQQA